MKFWAGWTPARCARPRRPAAASGQRPGPTESGGERPAAAVSSPPSVQALLGLLLTACPPVLPLQEPLCARPPRMAAGAAAPASAPGGSSSSDGSGGNGAPAPRAAHGHRALLLARGLPLPSRARRPLAHRPPASARRGAAVPPGVRPLQGPPSAAPASCPAPAGTCQLQTLDCPRSLAGPCSPIFGTSFLEAPFPPGLAVSGGVYGGAEQAELTLWELWCVHWAALRARARAARSLARLAPQLEACLPKLPPLTRRPSLSLHRPPQARPIRCGGPPRLAAAPRAPGQPAGRL